MNENRPSAASAAAHVINNLNNLPPADWAGPSIKCDQLKRKLDDQLTDCQYEAALESHRRMLEEMMALRLYIRGKIDARLTAAQDPKQSAAST